MTEFDMNMLPEIDRICDAFSHIEGEVYDVEIEDKKMRYKFDVSFERRYVAFLCRIQDLLLGNLGRVDDFMNFLNVDKKKSSDLPIFRLLGVLVKNGFNANVRFLDVVRIVKGGRLFGFKGLMEGSQSQGVRFGDIDIEKIKAFFLCLHKRLFSKVSLDYYLAFSFPWSYSQNEQWMHRLKSEYKLQKQLNSPPQIILKHFTLGKSLQERQIWALEFSSKEGASAKKVLIISARVHPGEVVASHMYRGIVNQILHNPLVIFFNVFSHLFTQ